MKTNKNIARLINKGDKDGCGKKWSYREYIIVRQSDSDYIIIKDSKLEGFTSNLIHAKELVDYYIRKNHN